MVFFKNFCIYSKDIVPFQTYSLADLGRVFRVSSSSICSLINNYQIPSVYTIEVISTKMGNRKQKKRLVLGKDFIEALSKKTKRLV